MTSFKMQLPWCSQFKKRLSKKFVKVKPQSNIQRKTNKVRILHHLLCKNYLCFCVLLCMLACCISYKFRAELKTLYPKFLHEFGLRMYTLIFSLNLAMTLITLLHLDYNNSISIFPFGTDFNPISLIAIHM